MNGDNRTNGDVKATGFLENTNSAGGIPDSDTLVISRGCLASKIDEAGDERGHLENIVPENVFSVPTSPWRSVNSMRAEGGGGRGGEAVGSERDRARGNSFLNNTLVTFLELHERARWNLMMNRNVSGTRMLSVVVEFSGKTVTRNRRVA